MTKEKAIDKSVNVFYVHRYACNACMLYNVYLYVGLLYTMSNGTALPCFMPVCRNEPEPSRDLHYLLNRPSLSSGASSACIGCA